MYKIAVFDFDGTITQSDTLLSFIRFSKGNISFLIGFLLFIPLLIGMKISLIPNWKVKQLMFQYFYKGTKIKTFDTWGEQFSKIITANTREKAKAKITELKKEGYIIVVLSASIENWIKPWANENGIDLVIATQIRVVNNIITGEFLSKNCYGIEKVNRLLENFPDRTNYYVIAFGDSRGDRELLSFADKSYYKVF